MRKLDVEPNIEISHNDPYDNAESEWHSPNSIDLYDLASAAGRLAGNLNNKPGALDDFFNKLKTLEQEWYEAEKRYHKLRLENDRLNNQLMHEQAKCAIYQRKLKFIQDNQKNFEKLKQVYLAMKCQEASKPSLNVQEQASQTFEFLRPQDTKSTSTCSVITCDKDVLTKYHGDVFQSDSMVSIKRSELLDAHENLQMLKNMIKRREYTWSVNVQREDTMKEEIRSLQEDKHSLEALLRVKDIELRALKHLRIEYPDEQEDNINNMKRIIGKLTKRLRDLEKVGKTGKFNIILNEKEKEVIQEIEDKVTDVKKPQAVKSQPVKINTNRSLPGTSSTRFSAGVKPALSSILEQTKILTDSTEEYGNDIHELELLGQIKKSIEVKQAALKEKVQQIITCTESRGKEK